MKDRTHDEAMADVFRKDPAYAAELLASIRTDGDAGELRIIRRQLAKAAADLAQHNTTTHAANR